MLTEIDVDNADGALLAGSFVRVSLHVKTAPLPEIPVEGLVSRHDKTFVPVVDDDSHVHYRPVGVGDDDGKNVRILEGIKVGERVALNVGDELDDGAPVQVVTPPGGAGAGGVPSQASSQAPPQAPPKDR
jgi:hypothetical protein